MNRSTVLFCGMAWAVGLSSITNCLAQEKPSVVGFSVAKKDPANEYGQSLVPGIQAGTQIHLRIVLKEKSILKIDGDATKFKVVDSSNKALELSENSNIAFFASISDDRHAVIVPIQLSDVPPTGTTSLAVTGEVTCSCGAEPKTESVVVKLVADEEVKLGPVTAKITEVTDGFEPDSKRVSLESNTSFDQIESLVFIDDKGKEVETSGAGGGSGSFGGDTTYSKSFVFKAAPEKIAKAKITYFQKIEAVKVPVEVKFGFDLGK